MYPGREFFAHSPLVYVTAEVTLSYEPRINEVEVRDVFARAIRHYFPVLSQETVLPLPLPETSDEIPPQVLPALRAFNTGKTTSVLLKATSLTFETVAYDRFESFSDGLTHALRSLADCVPQALVQRAGIRFVNELRVPHQEPGTAPHWDKWIASELLASHHLLPSGHSASSMGSVLYHVGDDDWVGFRWGDVVGTSIIDRDVPLRRGEVESGPFFALDIDSFWEPPEPVVLDTDQIAACYRRLHPPTGELFHAAITENARKHFRGEGT